MKALLIGLVLPLVLGTVHAQTPALIDWYAAPNSDGSTSPFSATPDYFTPLAMPTQGGETIITPLCYDNTGANQSITVTNQQGDTPALVSTTGTNTDNTKRCDIYVFSNVAAGNNWTKSHLNSGSSNLSTWQMWNVKAYNITATTPVDKAVCAASAGSASVSVTLPTLSNTGDFVLQFSYASNWVAPNQSGKFTVGSGFTSLWDQVGDGAGAQYQIYNSTAGFTSTLTQPTSARYITCALALKAGASGHASTLYPRVVAVEADAKPKNIGTSWNAAFNSITGNVYLSTLQNDPPAATPIVSSPSPNTAWTASGANGTSTNGHNNADVYSAHFNSAPGLFGLTITNQGGTSDAIYMFYDVVGGTTTLDGDTGASGGTLNLNGTQVVIGPNASGNFTWCSACLTPTQANDFIIGVYGEAWGTVTGMTAPAAAVNDSCFWLGTSIDGPSQTCENNGFLHYIDTGIGAITATWTLTAGGNTAPNWWGGRLAAYKSSTPPTLPCPVGTPVAGGTCHYAAANGSDSNSGTSESAPWQHAPGMPNCTGNCATYTPTAGTGIILRGGDTWHFGNSGATPYTGGTWNWTWDGSATNCDASDNPAAVRTSCVYLGVDPAWFTGATWSRPIMTADNPVCNASTLGANCISHPSQLTACTPGNTANCLGLFYVGSCAFQVGASNNLFTVNNNSLALVDNFEWTGLCQSIVQTVGNNGGFGQNDYIFNNGGGTVNVQNIFTNHYFHGFSHLQGNCTADARGLCFNETAFFGRIHGSSTFGPGNVCDGGDGDPTWVACMLWEGYLVYDNVFENMAQIVVNGAHVWHDNLWQSYYPTGDGFAHGNSFEANDDAPQSDNAGHSQPSIAFNAFFNNIVGHNAIGTSGDVKLWFCTNNTAAEYQFNNIVYDQGNGNNWDIDTSCGAGKPIYEFNNTVDMPAAASMNCTANLVAKNNHEIVDGGSAYHSGTCSISNETVMTHATATTQGYTASSKGTSGSNSNVTCANDTTPCAPTLITNSTVGAGSNDQVRCNELLAAADTSDGLNIVRAGTACQSDTTDACSYNQSTRTVSCPSRTVIARPPSAAPDTGGYQFAAGGSQASAPTCAPSGGPVPQIVTCTNSNGGTTVMCYRTDGTAPATSGDGINCAAGSTKYTSAFTISTAGTTLKAIAGTSILTDSSVVTYNGYVNGVAPAAGLFAQIQTTGQVQVK